MKIITWNCNMAFDKKAAHIMAQFPDIVIVPECGNPDKFHTVMEVYKPTSVVWDGLLHFKGLAIFSFNGYKLRLLDSYNPLHRIVMPVEVTKGKKQLNLLGVWTIRENLPRALYLDPLWNAIDEYDTFLSAPDTIIAGDFNSNVQWDRKSRERTHVNLVKKLAQKGLHSAYHLHHSKAHGVEDHPTFFLYRHASKPYHLDFCFLSDNLMSRLDTVEVGSHTQWAPHSDHSPLIVTLK